MVFINDSNPLKRKAFKMSSHDKQICIVVAFDEYPKGSPDGYQRLRRLLKSLLRVYGLKCVDLRQVETRDPKDGAQTKPGTPGNG